MKKLSIVILNYNTKDLLGNCLESIKQNKDEVDLEVVVSDNASSDGSVEMIRGRFPWVKLIENKENLGFAAGNNQAKDKVTGEYVLILNSDTEIKKGTLKESVKYLDNHPEVGALTCKLVLPDGRLDPDTRRSFPTPWVALTHFSGLDRVFPKSSIFSKYWYGYKSPDEIQEVDVLQGAYLLARKKVLDEIDWFNENYFLDGEDIDLCWKIKERGYKIVYYPKVSILHVKGASKGKVISLGRVTREERLTFVNAGVDSMATFYKKRLWKKYPLILSLLVIFGIRTLKAARYIKALFS